MDPITLATVTAAVVTLAQDAAKELAPQIAKDAWGKIKECLGWTKTPPAEDFARKVAETLAANTQTAVQILAELKKANVGAASRMASKVSIVVTNTVGGINAGGNVATLQAEKVNAQGDIVIGRG